MRRKLGENTYWVEEDDKTHIVTSVDVESTLEFANAARNARSQFNPGESMTLAAAIPMAVVAQFAMERGITVHEVMNQDVLLAQLLAWAPKFKTIDKSVF